MLMNKSCREENPQKLFAGAEIVCTQHTPERPASCERSQPILPPRAPREWKNNKSGIHPIRLVFAATTQGECVAHRSLSIASMSILSLQAICIA